METESLTDFQPLVKSLKPGIAWRMRMETQIGRFPKIGVMLFSLLVGVVLARADHVQYRWDIVSVIPAVRAGGVASALAIDGSKITLTGSGTFVPGLPDAVTGGGTWVLRNSKGDLTDSGVYWVTGLVSWHLAPGALPAALTDEIGKHADTRAGLAVLRIAYSNGSRGVLFVSCNLPGAPPSIFEGITATMGFSHYWDRQAPVDGAEGNRTLFHATSTSPSSAPTGMDAAGTEAAPMVSRAVSADGDPRWGWGFSALTHQANDGSKITLTGSGTFVPSSPDDVAGGGTWVLRDAKGDFGGSGTYIATGLLGFWLAPGTLAGSPDSRAGLAVFPIAYSNGKRGILVLTCSLSGTPGSVGEDAIASMDFAHFWKSPRDCCTGFSVPPSTPRKPAISAGGVVNAATSKAGPLAPNSIISIYGANLSLFGALAQVASGRMPNTLFGVRVNIGPAAAPLLFVNGDQINAVVPAGLPSGSANVTVTVEGLTSPVERVTIGPAGPGIFVFSDGKSAAAIHADGSAVGRFAGATPAKAGEIVSVFATGFGGTTPAVDSGEVFPARAPILQPAQVTIGGTAVTPEYIGGAPGFAGLYQVNLRVPMLPAGDHDVVVTIASVSSPAGVKLAVQ